MTRLALLVSSLALAGLGAVSRPDAPADAAPPKLPVKLMVVLVFDQMRADYVDKWRPLFGQRGFQRIQKDGAWFANCYYPYASTITGPGHSALLSGATLDKTGIIGNEWYDRKAAATVYCAGSDRYDLVPLNKPKPDVKTTARADDSAVPNRGPKTAVPKPDAKTSAQADEPAKKRPAVGNPDRMLSETVADVLKRETHGRGKVFGISLKDRAAILPTGKRPDGAFWFSGLFVTSTYYTDTLPKWVTRFNDRHLADEYYGRDWVRSRPGLNYVEFSGPDDVPSESNPFGLGTTFPHHLTGGKDKLQKEFYDALVASPMGNELLLAFAKRCIVEENLGRDDTPDLLVVSFSSNDLVGHAYGPDSQEVLDITLRSDEVVAELLEFLDTTVGRGNYGLAISADHGIGSMPEVAAKTIPGAKDATRVSSAKLVAGAEMRLRTVYGKPADVKGKPGLWLEALQPPWVYLNARQIEAKGLNQGEVAKTLAGWLREQPGIQGAYALPDILAADHPDDVLRLVQRSTYPERSGDVYIVLKPYNLIGDPLKSKGATHGSPHDYDRHVPLMVYGPGVSGGLSAEGVVPQQMALIASHFLGLPKPKDAGYDLPKFLQPR